MIAYAGLLVANNVRRRSSRKELERFAHEVCVELEDRAVSGIGVNDELAPRKPPRQIARVLARDHAITVAVGDEDGVANLRKIRGLLGTPVPQRFQLRLQRSQRYLSVAIF